MRQRLRSDTTEVWRIDDTVRRQPHAGSLAVRALLEFLNEAGFAYAPRFLGIDRAGREMFEWIDGEPLGEDMTDEQLAAIGVLLREYHRVVRRFRPDPDLPWRTSPMRCLGRGEILIHNDVNPGNVIWRDGRIVGLIDWDFARPGRPAHDLAYAAMRCVPLFPPEDGDRAAVAAEQARRIVLLCKSYGYRPLSRFPEQLAMMTVIGQAQKAWTVLAGDTRRYWYDGWIIGQWGAGMQWLNEVRQAFEQLIKPRAAGSRSAAGR